MHDEPALERLLDTAVLSESDDGSVRFTDAFAAALETNRAAIDSGESGPVRGLLPDDVDEEFEDWVADIAEEHPAFATSLATLAEFLEDPTVDELLGLATVMDLFSEESPRDEGTPTGFLPIRGELLPTVLDFYEVAVVYVWLDDCDPCELVKAEYDAIGEEFPDEFAQFAVYGPNAARTLHDEYDVSGGPVSLFTIRGTVDVRLTGEHGGTAILNEASTVLDRA